MNLVQKIYYSLVFCIYTQFLFLLPNAQARSRDFFCELRGGIPITMAQTEEGKIPIIYWKSKDLPKDLTPQSRCEQVSAKFQAAQDNGLLNYLSIGSTNGVQVICISDRLNGECLDTLFTLNRGSDPKKILKSLLDLRGLANGKSIEQSDDDRIYINFLE